MIDATTLALIKKMGGGSGGGGGADILNTDGIIKQEVLPEGYPYVTQSTILPETTVEVVDMREVLITDAFELTVGNTYTVNWSGTNYECVAQYFDMDGIATVVLGDIGGVTGGTSTGEPFIIVAYPAEIVAEAGAYGMVMALDGSTSVTLSIMGNVYQPMSANYLPAEMKPLIINVDELEKVENADNRYVYDNPNELLARFLSGLTTIFHLNYTSGSTVYHDYGKLIGAYTDDGSSELACFVSFYMNQNMMQIVLVPPSA